MMLCGLILSFVIVWSKVLPVFCSSLLPCNGFPALTLATQTVPSSAVPTTLRPNIFPSTNHATSPEMAPQHNGISVTQPTFQPTTVPTAKQSQQITPIVLSNGGTAGIVIAVLVTVGLLVYLLYKRFSPSHRKKNARRIPTTDIEDSNFDTKAGAFVSWPFVSTPARIPTTDIEDPKVGASKSNRHAHNVPALRSPKQSQSNTLGTTVSKSKSHPVLRIPTTNIESSPPNKRQGYARCQIPPTDIESGDKRSSPPARVRSPESTRPTPTIPAPTTSSRNSDSTQLQQPSPVSQTSAAVRDNNSGTSLPGPDRAKSPKRPQHPSQVSRDSASCFVRPRTLSPSGVTPLKSTAATAALQNRALATARGTVAAFTPAPVPSSCDTQEPPRRSVRPTSGSSFAELDGWYRATHDNSSLSTLTLAHLGNPFATGVNISSPVPSGCRDPRNASSADQQRPVPSVLRR
jgi:hypothetical protein